MKIVNEGQPVLPIEEIRADAHRPADPDYWKAIVDGFSDERASADIYVGDGNEGDYLRLSAEQFDDLAEVCKAAAAEIRRRAEA